MRIFINTDLEGITGTYTMEMMHKTDAMSEYAYKQYALDINAAAEGAFEGGAEFVSAIDGHGTGDVLDPSLLDPRINFLDKRKNQRKGYFGNLEDGYDACFMIGTHAMAGTQNAFLDHTQSSLSWFEYKINGKPTGETGMWAAACAHYNIPVVLVTGDEAACIEARNFLGNIETVAVKRGIGRNQTELYDFDLCRKKIKEAAKQSVLHLINKTKNYKLYTPNLPAEITLTYNRSDFCDYIMSIRKDLERIDARTVRKIITNYTEVLV